MNWWVGGLRGNHYQHLTSCPVFMRPGAGSSGDCVRIEGKSCVQLVVVDCIVCIMSGVSAALGCTSSEFGRRGEVQFRVLP